MLFTLNCFAVCRYWYSTSERSFKIKLFAIWQKPKSMSEIYNVKKMLEVFLRSFADRDIEMTLALPIHMAWDDFIFSCHGKYHDAILKHFVKEEYRQTFYLYFKTAR